MSFNIWNFIAKYAEEKPVEVPIEIKKLPLKSDQYYPSKQKKTHIILHHTAGGSAASSVASWAASREHVATAYLIDRDGTIYETYSPEFWAYHLGKGVPTSLEKASIGIEMSNYGQLTPNTAGELLTYTKKVIPKEKAAKVTFRGFNYYEAYTPEQIAALKVLLPYLIRRFSIPIQPDRKNFYEYQDPTKLPPGIYSHTTVRKDKVDIFPQKELVDLILSL